MQCTDNIGDVVDVEKVLYAAQDNDCIYANWTLIITKDFFPAETSWILRYGDQIIAYAQGDDNVIHETAHLNLQLGH